VGSALQAAGGRQAAAANSAPQEQLSQPWRFNMSLKMKCCSGLAVAGALLLVASCAEGPTLPPDDAGVGPVLKKGGGGGPPQFRDVDVHISNVVPNALVGDTWSDTLDYKGGWCGTVAKAYTSFSMWPFYGGMNRKELKDYENDLTCWENGSLIRRWMRVDLAAARVHKICRPGDDDFDPSLESCPNDNPTEHVGEMTLGELADSLWLDDPAGRDTVRLATVGIFDSETDFSRGGLRIDYCGAASHPLKFDASRFLGSNDVSVTRPDTATTHIETQSGLDNNVGLCGHYDETEGQAMVLLLHLDFEYDVKDKPSG
jgi:hypothetical protein